MKLTSYDILTKEGCISRLLTFICLIFIIILLNIFFSLLGKC